MPRSRIGYQDTRFARQGAHRYPGRQLPRFARNAGAAREASDAPELDDDQPGPAMQRARCFARRKRTRVDPRPKLSGVVQLGRLADYAGHACFRAKGAAWSCSPRVRRQFQASLEQLAQPRTPSSTACANSPLPTTPRPTETLIVNPRPRGQAAIPTPATHERPHQRSALAREPALATCRLGLFRLDKISNCPLYSQCLVCSLGAAHSRWLPISHVTRRRTIMKGLTRRVMTLAFAALLMLVTGAQAATWELKNVSLPTGGTEGELEGVSCFSATVCTAGGHYYNGSINGAMGDEWNGTSWSVASVIANPGEKNGDLRSISCFSATRCIGAGAYGGSGGTGNTLVEASNKGVWTHVSSPNHGGGKA